MQDTTHAPPRGPIARRRLVFRFLWRRPGRTFGILALLALIGLVFGGVALFLWFDYHLRAARRATEQGHNPVAIEHLLACRRLRPDSPEVLLLSARVARCSGAWGEAETLLDHYWGLRGDDDALVFERLLLRATQGEEEATRLLLRTRTGADDPSAPVAWEAVVSGLIYRFRLKEAETEIGRWLERDPDSPPALLALGKLQEQRDESSEARQTYRRLVEIDPEHDQARMRMTTILIQLSRAEEALPHLEYLRARLPHHPELLVQSAQALDMLGRADEARATLDECLRHHPDHASALLERGRIARQDGDALLAEEYLGRSVRLDPGNVTAHYQYSLVLTSNGKKAEAAKEEAAVQRIQADGERIKDLLQGRLQQKSDDPSAYHEVALIAMRAGRPKEALRWLLEALRVDPDHAPTHRTLAALYHELGNPILSSRHRAIAQRLGGQPKP